VIGAVCALAVVPAELSACAAASPQPVAQAEASPGPASSARARPARRATPVPTPRGPHPAAPPGWLGPIYASHLHGYDISYPQCPGVPAPAGATFSVIGANAGKAFTVNPCLREEWLTARGVRALYFNTGYDPDNAGKVTADCGGRAQDQPGDAARRTAYAIGCSEAAFAVSTLAAVGASRTVMIWLDVEQSNSWDLANLELNRTALQAEVDQLAAMGRLVGLYGTSYQWHLLLGDWSPAGVVADWVAGQTPEAACGRPGFSGHPVWMAQELDTWGPAAVDSDWTC
jgi:hypothetical protein